MPPEQARTAAPALDNPVRLTQSCHEKFYPARAGLDISHAKYIVGMT